MLAEDLKLKQRILQVSVHKCNTSSVEAVWVEQPPY